MTSKDFKDNANGKQILGLYKMKLKNNKGNAELSDSDKYECLCGGKSGLLLLCFLFFGLFLNTNSFLSLVLFVVLIVLIVLIDIYIGKLLFKEQNPEKKTNDLPPYELEG